MRKSFFIIILAAGLVVTGCHNRQQVLPAEYLQTEVLIPTAHSKTTCKDSPSWAYAMLATIESEHLIEGDSVNLSISFPLRMLLLEEAQKSYFTKGHFEPSVQGMGPMVIHLIEKYGTVPYDSYPDEQNLNYTVICRSLANIARECAGRHTGLNHIHHSFSESLDRYMGFLPGKEVFFLGAEYTKGEFARSVCAPGEYISLTSFTHHPYRKPFTLEIPDNVMQDKFYNLPIRQLLSSIEKALRHGHPVCWEGDITNPDFNEKVGISGQDISKSACTPRNRQRMFEQLFTTDDHAFELIGIAHDPARHEYFIARDPQSPYASSRPVYLSRNYLYLYTIAVTMSKTACGI